jgi:hypothetical protein
MTESTTYQKIFALASVIGFIGGAISIYKYFQDREYTNVQKEIAYLTLQKLKMDTAKPAK